MKKNIKFVITIFVFSSSKCTKIRWGSLRRSPIVGWEGGYPLSVLLLARRLRRLEPLFSAPLKLSLLLHQITVNWMVKVKVS